MHTNPQIKPTYKHIIYLILCFSLLQLNAQNLVKNPSFESSKKCSKKPGNFEKDVLEWRTPSDGSTDYYSDCSPEMSTNHNFIGRQQVYHGKAFAGFYMLGPDNYREYITGVLTQTLVKGKRYKVSFMVSLADKAGLAVDEFQILFTEKSPKWSTKKSIAIDYVNNSEEIRLLKVRSAAGFSNKRTWTNVSTTFVANGTETFVTLGNFKRDKRTRTKVTNDRLRKASYYYIDQVSVVEDEGINLDEIYVIKDLLFTSDSYVINKEAKGQLRELVRHLKRNPRLNVTIYGHSDNEGDAKYNKLLSLNRAKSVGEFLLDNGLTFDRIKWQGYGDEIPLATNNSETGRLKNRRVEFVVSESKYNTYANNGFEEDKE
ncbi:MULTISPECIES: OmpA family protein [Cellulophaga]|uniref:OmpA/MotB domain protein n=1 Tax=Cellulophaga lytica (strain ATCC 23178 / DSM 7489 / JCM 8516 / NBRC 14961 / NCIMB 1423 / VKM B-1433 / Cy l20) TaxID=867900 RepID=F0RHW1_CELLC|nr:MULTISPECIES: OmpA family protein [Cellulophaga]ADY29223.1 OmpA/MotB domain protein [Cellulophaga lytica DSM 7489]TVZ08205.1 OmpA family protein [Cellulophaga sp. RHA_52]WQG76602.1 OmpA family protein [Cellulophaga lytica]